MNESRKRAVENYRSRLSDRGLARFEVVGRETDRGLLRAIARRLADDGDEAEPRDTGVGGDRAGSCGGV